MESLEGLYARHDGYVSQRWSGYLPILDREFAARRGERIRLLEIGIQNGGSLELWAKYFTDAEILVGNDVDPRCGDLTFADARIATVVGSITKPSTISAIRAISDRFDIVIDDGSHRSDDIIAAFVDLFPALESGGVYVIEDLHCSYFSSYGGGLFAQASALGFLRRLVDVINVEHWGLELSPSDVLQPLSRKEIGPAFLAALPAIASIEFHDSMAIIRKGNNPASRLGARVVVGTSAPVDAGPLKESDRPLAVEPQMPDQAAVDPLVQERVIDELRSVVDELEKRQSSLLHQIKERDAELAAVWRRLERILASPSYRVMNGPRRAFRALFRRGVSGSS